MNKVEFCQKNVFFLVSPGTYWSTCYHWRTRKTHGPRIMQLVHLRCSNVSVIHSNKIWRGSRGWSMRRPLFSSPGTWRRGCNLPASNPLPVYRPTPKVNITRSETDRATLIESPHHHRSFTACHRYRYLDCTYRPKHWG